MRVLRGRAATMDTDREQTETMVSQAVETDEPALRVWTPHQQLAFGRRDTHEDGYNKARAIGREHGYPPVERQVGGRAVAYTGTTLAVVYAEPDPDRTAIEARYDTATERYLRAFERLGIDALEGEPDHSFCPGTHSLSADGKLAGLAQRVRRDVATTAAIVIVCDDEAIAEVLAPVYDALGLPFDPSTVDSVAAAGGPSTPKTVADAIVEAYGGSDATVDRVRET